VLPVVAAVIEREGRIMLCQRLPDVHNALKWEFPGGKIEAGESPEAALARELREELGIRVAVGRVRDAVFYRYPDRDVLVLFYGCAIVEGEPKTLECNAIAWAAPGEMTGYDFAGADLAFVERNYTDGAF
jgi:8-oxo-dGTP diphosphatase